MKTIFLSVMTHGSWSDMSYKKLNISWSLAVRFAKYIASKKQTQVRLAEGHGYENPYYLNGHYFN